VTTVKFAYPAPVPSLLPLYVATQEPSICKPFGVKIEAVAVDPEAVVASLVSKSVQLAETPTSILFPASAKQPKAVQAVAITGPEAVALWGAKGVKSVADLKGKALAATAQGATSDIYLRTLLKRARLAPGTDVKIVYTKSGPSMVAQAVSGHADAFPYPPPLPEAAAKAGFQRLPDGDLDPASPESLILSHGIAANPSYASGHPQVISNTLKCLDAVIDYIPGHKAERDAALAKYAGIAPSAAENAYNINKVTFSAGLKPATEEAATKLIDILVGSGIFSRDQFRTPVRDIVSDQYLK
jgi:ABC-type nitrate/sulfonate/bicarbonate transport system substrate-binding protein